MTKTKSRFFMLSFWRNMVLGTGLLAFFGSGIFTFTMAQTNGYYIIDSADSRYPQGCNTPGLSNPSQYCILKVQPTAASGVEPFLIAPWNTDPWINQGQSVNYCNNLNVAGVSWKMVSGCQKSNTCELYWVYANNGKLTNYRKNPTNPHDNAAKYWTKINGSVVPCRHDGFFCGNSAWNAGVRCIAPVLNASLFPPEGERCFDFNAGSITNYKKGVYPECGASVTIPASIGGQAVTAIGDNAFKNKGIQSVTIPEWIISLGNYAFYQNQLTSLVLPNTLTSLWNYTFEHNKISSVILPNGISVLGKGIFSDNQLVSIKIPQSVTSIQEYALYKNKLTSLILPSNLTNIDVQAFVLNPWKPALGNKVEGKIAKDPSTVSVAADANIQLIYNDGTTPASCFGFSNGTITSYNAAPADCGKDVVIPKMINGQAVTAIGPSAFAGKGLTSLKLPDGLLTVGNQSFMSNALASLIIPDSVTTIAEHAFRLNQLTSVTFGNSLKEIKLWAFENNKITSLTIPNSVITIGDTAFANNQITSLHIGNGVTTIGYAAFKVNPMTSLTLGNSVTAIGNYAFENNRLTTVQLPSTLTTVGAYSFFGCPGKPALGNKVEGKIAKDPSTVSVGGFANIQLVYDDGSTPASCFGFSNGTITSYNAAPADCGRNVVIPKMINGQAVVRIGDNAFDNKGLTSVAFPNSVTTIGENAFKSNLLTWVIIPNSITTIGDRAFAGNHLTSVVIPNLVITIGRGAFSDNQLTSVTIPNSVTTIGNEAFAVNRLTSVTIPNSVISIMSSAFRSNPWKSELGNKVEGIIKKDPSTVSVAPDANIELIHDNNTPEHCFQFSNGKIIKYKKDSTPECGADVVIPKQIGAVNVTVIGSKAFENMGITSVKIPSTVRLIAAQAFMKNDLTALEIPNSVNEIGLQAFAYNKLSSISGDVTNHTTYVKIGPAAFNDNHLPDNQAFFYSRYTSLKNTTWGSPGYHWGLASYGGITKDNVKVPKKNSQVIGTYAFFKCNINSVLLPEWVTAIGEQAFSSNNITKLVLPETLKYIYSEAFANNPGKIEYAGKVEGNVSVDPSTITNMTGSNIELVWLYTPASCFDFSNGTITNYKKGSSPACGNEVKIPKLISGNNVTTIGAQAFHNKQITSVIFPDTLISIENEAFKGNQLTGVELPNTLIKIADLAFVQNPWKPSLGNKVEGRIKKDPDTVAVADNANIELVREYIPTLSNCFEVNSGVIIDYRKGSLPECGVDVVVPSQISGVVIAQIGPNAFWSKGIHSVVLPTSLVRIQASAFSGNQLTSIDIPNSVVQIDAQAFSANKKNPVWGFREAGLTGLSLAANANLLINPLFLDVVYENLDGEALLATGTFVGSGKSDFSWWSPTTAAQWFQPGGQHTLTPPHITGYTAPAAKQVLFPTRITHRNNRIRVKLIYQFKPELILHYAFDILSSLGKDSSVRRNHGVHTNMSSVIGRVDRSISIKWGKQMTSQRPVYVDGTKAFTVSYWVKPQQLAATSTALVDSSAGTNGFKLGIDQQGAISFAVGNTSNRATATCGTTKLPMKHWSHIAGVFNMMSGSFDCYLDGAKIGSVSIGSFTGMSAQPLVIGKHSADYQVLLDELKVRNYALTPEKIKTEYDDGNKPMVTVTYLNEWDEVINGQAETIMRSSTDGHSFQWDTDYKISAPSLADTRALDPKEKIVRFSTTKNNALELSFKYKEHYCRRFEGKYKVSKNECKALSDFYTATQGSGWTQHQGWDKMAEKNYADLCSWRGVSCTNNKVTGLELSNNNLKGSLAPSFQQLVHLENLNLSKNAGLRHSLAQIHHPNLKELNLNTTSLDEGFPTNFFQRNAKLEKVSLANAGLSWPLPRLNPNLKELLINNNRLNGKLPASLAQLNQLEKLNMDDNLLIEPIPSELRKASFPKLKLFSISNNYIAKLENNQTYLSLKKNKIISAASAQNIQQQKIVFENLQGEEVKVADNLLSGQVITIKVVRKLWKQGKWRLWAPLQPTELSILRNDNITLLEQNFPIYKIKQSNPEHDGLLILMIKGANPDGESVKAQIKLSTKDILAESPNTGTWSMTGGTQPSGLDKGGLNFELWGKYLDEFFSAVHFNVAGNDFGGGFFWLPVAKLETPILIQTQNQNGDIEVRECHNQLRGFYYNSQRGERLRPLDKISQDALQKFSPTTYDTSLQTDGGWYTSCKGVNENCGSGSCIEDPFGIYGAIIHRYKGEEFHLNAGIAHDAQQNKMKSDGLRCNFQRLNNSYYFWYIYDDRGHIGFVGAKIKTGAMLDSAKVDAFHQGLNTLLDQGRCMSQIFDYNGKDLSYNQDNKIPGFNDSQDIHNFLDLNPGTAKTTLFNLGIKGIIGLTSEINNEEKKFFEGNTQESTLLLRTDATISKVVNTAGKHAESLCRGKWQTQINTHNDVICVNEHTLLNRGLSASELAGKTVVIRNQNLVLTQLMQPEEQPINLFIDRGNLILPSEIQTWTLSAFDSYGYPSTTTDPQQSKAGFLKGNFIINGLLLWGNEGLHAIKNKLYIHGKLVSFNTFKEPTEERIRTVQTLLDEVHNWKSEYKEKIAIDKLFTWWCALDIGTDGTRCKGLSKQEREAQGKLSSLLIDKAFGIIDMDFASPFFD